MSAAGLCKALPGYALQGLAVRQESGQFYLLLTLEKCQLLIRVGLAAVEIL